MQLNLCMLRYKLERVYEGKTLLLFTFRVVKILLLRVLKDKSGDILYLFNCQQIPYAALNQQLII